MRNMIALKEDDKKWPEGLKEIFGETSKRVLGNECADFTICRKYPEIKDKAINVAAKHVTLAANDEVFYI
jgi:hypothetical protein